MLERFAPKFSAQAHGPASLRASQDIARPLAAEALGSGLIAFITVAAGLLAERYSGGSIGLAMLITALAAASAFAVLAQTLGRPAVGLFNPGMALGLAVSRKLPLGFALLAGAAQVSAAMVGVVVAHLVTDTGFVQVATQIQAGTPVWVGEFVGTVLVIFTLLRLVATAPRAVPLLGALAILATAMATPSLSLANPAVTLARGLTDSFTSIRLADACVIVACQFAGALAATLLNLWLFPVKSRSAPSA